MECSHNRLEGGGGSVTHRTGSMSRRRSRSLSKAMEAALLAALLGSNDVVILHDGTVLHRKTRFETLSALREKGLIEKGKFQRFVPKLREAGIPGKLGKLTEKGAARVKKLPQYGEVMALKVFDQL